MIEPSRVFEGSDPGAWCKNDPRKVIVLEFVETVVADNNQKDLT